MRNTLRTGAAMFVLSCGGLALAQQPATPPGQRSINEHLAAAKILEGQGDLAGAERELRAAMAAGSEGDDAQAKAQLLKLLMRQGRGRELMDENGRIRVGRDDPRPVQGGAAPGYEDPVMRLIKVLDSGAPSQSRQQGSPKDPVADARDQLQTLGILVVPYLEYAFPSLGAFGITNALYLMRSHDDPRITALLLRQIESADPAVVSAIVMGLPRMQAGVGVEVARRIAAQPAAPEHHGVALAILLGKQGDDVAARELAQRLLGDASEPACRALVDALNGCDRAWAVDILSALRQRGAPETRAAATFQWLVAAAVEEAEAFEAIESLDRGLIPWRVADLARRHPQWVRVGAFALEAARVQNLERSRLQALVNGFEWWRRPEVAAPVLLALPTADHYLRADVIKALQAMIDHGWRLPAELDEPFLANVDAASTPAMWTYFVSALPVDAEARAMAAWSASAQRQYPLAAAVRDSGRPWHRLIARHLLSRGRWDEVSARLIDRDWSGAPGEAIDDLVALARKWPVPPQGVSHNWHGSLLQVFLHHPEMPVALLEPMILAGDADALQAVAARHPEEALRIAHGLERMSNSHQAILAAWLDRKGGADDVSTAVRLLRMTSNYSDKIIAYLRRQAGGALEVIRLAELPTRLESVVIDQCRAAAMAEARQVDVSQLPALLELMPRLPHDVVRELAEALQGQVRDEHAAALIAAIQSRLGGPWGDGRSRSSTDLVAEDHLTQWLFELLGSTGSASALPMLRRCLGQTEMPPIVVGAAARAALQVAGAERKGLIREILDSPRAEIAQEAFTAAELRGDPDLRDHAQKAVLRFGHRAERCLDVFQVLDEPDRVVMAKAIVDSPRMAEFGGDLMNVALGSFSGNKDGRFLPQLERAATHPFWTVRVRAAELLGNTFVRDAAPPLLDLLKDDVADVRKAAQQGLDQIANYLDERAKWEKRF
ncbi:MAG: HEAT repeat domain-containing protein [Planctomycetes bacterium]|nr:HEAT repeat domain-containing protein [Planctomycetota bacterium]